MTERIFAVLVHACCKRSLSPMLAIHLKFCPPSRLHLCVMFGSYM